MLTSDQGIQCKLSSDETVSLRKECTKKQEYISHLKRKLDEKDQAITRLERDIKRMKWNFEEENHRLSMNAISLRKNWNGGKEKI